MRRPPGPLAPGGAPSVTALLDSGGVFAPDQTARLDVSAREAPPASTVAPVDTTVWVEGNVVAERYHLARHLGAGAMGEVFLANDHLLRKEVALKVLRSDLAENRTIFKRFLREVALAHSVTHPNVVRIYDTGEAHGLPYLSMEYLRGQTLEELLAESQDSDTPPMTLDEIRETATEILSGLQAAHEAGVIHRDLKPANVMLTRRGAIVMDFGVAGFDALPSAKPDPSKLGSLVRTEAGTIFGSPAYMAPELWDGGLANVQTDLYSFGVMLYQMLTGQLPYNAPNARLFLEKLKANKPKPVRSLRRDTPWNLALLVERCMSHDAERRPRSATSATRLVAPLTRARRSVIAGVVGAATLFGASSMIFERTQEWDAQGLPDALALADVHAAVRHYDVGDYEPALTMLDRVAARAPRSASVAFWRALIHHELTDPEARAEDCKVPGSFEGSENWRELARAACGSSFSLATPIRDMIDGRGAMPPAYLALAIEYDLVPRLEAVRDPGPALRHEARAAEDALDRFPEWNLDGVMLPLRWELARARLQVATGHTDTAVQHMDEILERHPSAPAARVYGAWLFSQLGQRNRARALADAAFEADPRPALRLALDEGRVHEAGSHVDGLLGHPLHSAALQTWCAYAFRYEIERVPRRCRDLPPGLVRAMWAGAAVQADLAVMTRHERDIVEAQADVNMGRCLDRAPRVATLTHTRPPFSTYHRQLEVSAALCVHDPASASRPLASQLAETLTALDPEDPWSNLLDAQVDLTMGRQTLAASRRQVAAELWSGADADLPLVGRLRDAVAGRNPSTAADIAADVQPLDLSRGTRVRGSLSDFKDGADALDGAPEEAPEVAPDASGAPLHGVQVDSKPLISGGARGVLSNRASHRPT